MRADERCRCGHTRAQHGPDGCLEYPAHCHGFTLYVPAPVHHDDPDVEAKWLAMTEATVDEHDTSWVEKHLGRCGCCASPKTRRQFDIVADALTTDADDEEKAA